MVSALILTCFITFSVSASNVAGSTQMTIRGVKQVYRMKDGALLLETKDGGEAYFKYYSKYLCKRRSK